MTMVKIAEGLSESNRLLYQDDQAGPVADNANWTIQLPTREVAKAVVPCVKAVVTYGAGTPGARLATYRPVVDVGSALAGVEVVSYNEATGVLTLTNRTGGALSNVRTIIEIVASS